MFDVTILDDVIDMMVKRSLQNVIFVETGRKFDIGGEKTVGVCMRERIIFHAASFATA